MTLGNNMGAGRGRSRAIVLSFAICAWFVSFIHGLLLARSHMSTDVLIGSSSVLPVFTFARILISKKPSKAAANAGPRAEVSDFTGKFGSHTPKRTQGAPNEARLCS